MSLRLNGIILFVQDVQQLKDFYTSLFGLTVLEEQDDQWVLLQAGDCTIGLHRIDAAYASEDGAPFQFDNNTKLVFETDEDLSRLRESLLLKGVAMRELKRFDGYPFYICDGEDPEGNVFQLKQRIL